MHKSSFNASLTIATNTQTRSILELQQKWCTNGWWFKSK
jgi:hypothetical protein